LENLTKITEVQSSNNNGVVGEI